MAAQPLTEGATKAGTRAGSALHFFSELFLPEGYPTSVAIEYFDFQLWDTIQQVTFYVNTVVSLQAYFVFHGVGVPGYTGIDAAILEFSRSALGTMLTLASSSPAFVSIYKRYPVFFKFFAGLMEALEHMVEIVAGIAFSLEGRAIFNSSLVLLFYCNPLISTFRGPAWDASRFIILQHFADDHQRGADYKPLYGAGATPTPACRVPLPHGRVCSIPPPPLLSQATSK
jgi:hypothetical protein